MAALAVRQASPDGLIDALVATAGGGDTFPNTGDQILTLNNPTGGGITVTIVTPSTVSGRSIGDVSQLIAAGARYQFGPFDPALFDDASGNVSLTYSGAGLTAQVTKVKP